MYDDRKKTLDDFRNIWGNINKVRDMTIDDYCGYDNEDSFIRWIEWKTRDLGSITGAYAIKVGIYEMSPGHEKPTSSRYRYDDRYMWVATLNDDGKETAENAFEWVRKYVLQIISSIETGHPEDIDKVDTLWRGYKYKIAFLYQEILGKEIRILPVFNKDHLAKYLGYADDSLLVLYDRAIKEFNIKDTNDAYAFADKMYEKISDTYSSHIGKIEKSNPEQDTKNQDMDDIESEIKKTENALDKQNTESVRQESEEDRKIKQYELDLQEKLKPTKRPFRIFASIALLIGFCLLCLEFVAVFYKKTSDGFRVGQWFWLFWPFVCAFMWCFYDVMLWGNSHLRDWIKNKKNEQNDNSKLTKSN